MGGELVVCSCRRCAGLSIVARTVPKATASRHLARYPPVEPVPPSPPGPSTALSNEHFNDPELDIQGEAPTFDHDPPNEDGFGEDWDDWDDQPPAPLGSAQDEANGQYFYDEDDDGGAGTGADREETAGGGPGGMAPAPELEEPNIPDTTWEPAYEWDDSEENHDLDDLHPQGPAYYGERKELPHIRMAYLQAVLNNVTAHVPIRTTNANLASTIDMFDVAGVMPDAPIPARTLQSAKRRLGIDADQYIVQYAACPKCWKHYSPTQVKQLESPGCTVEGCPGVIYQARLNTKNNEIRRPQMIIPHTPLIAALRSILGRKGMRRMIRDSRNQPLNQNNDIHFVMKDMHDGKMWHELRTGITRKVGNHGTVKDSDDQGGQGTRLTEHRFGLHLVVNLDWFGALKRPHSTGPIYISIADLPREERFLQRNVICTSITPGPLEPTTQQLNHVLELSVRDALRLKQGVRMEIWDDTDTALVEEEVYADFVCNNCDTPGARKFAGFAGHTADLHPCPWCTCTSLDIDQPEGYDISQFTPKSDDNMLKQKFYSRNSSDVRQASILDHHGVRWAMFDVLPGWRPSTQTALDFMHAIFLGVVAWLFTRLLFGAHMFPGQMKKRLESVINGIHWPSHATRLPKNLGENPSLKKADEWRRLLTITPPVLWYAWMDPNGTIPDTEPPLPPNAKLKTTHSRKRLTLYCVILLLCAAVRLLSTRTITMSQALTGQAYLSSYCLKMLQLGAKLSPNHHFVMHMASMIQLFGPVYAWWLFAFERFNGLLEKVNTNGHDGGRIELTLLRNWVQAHLLYNLLLHLPDDTPNQERDLIDRIIKAEAERGGMAAEIAMFAAEASNERIQLPSQLPRTPIDIHKIQLSPHGHDGTSAHDLLLSYCQQLWPDLNLRRQYTANVQPGSTPFIGNQVVRRLPYIKKDSLRFGCKSNNRTQADSFAFIARNSIRIPISIEDIWLVKIPNTDKPPHVCLLVRDLDVDPTIPVPWSAFASLLGIHTSFANKYRQYKVISANSIDCPMALVPIPLHDGQELWASISFDRVSTEPEEEFDG